MFDGANKMNTANMAKLLWNYFWNYSLDGRIYLEVGTNVHMADL